MNVTKQLRIQCASIAMVILGCAPDDPPQSLPTPTTPETEAKAEPEVDPNVSPKAAPNAAPEIPDRTIWQGVYTDQQRRRGEAAYASSCVRCHGENLEGEDVVPELVGDDFLKRWSRKRAGNLFAFMRKEMPPKEKDKLTPVEYADLLAYILSKNQAPVGENELPSDFPALQAIRMDGRDE